MDESTSRQMPPDGAKQVWYAQPPPYQPASYDNNFQQGQNAPPNYSGQPPVQPAWGSQQPQQYQPPPNQQHAMYSGGPPPPSFHPQPPPQMNQQVVIMGSTGYPRVHHECVQSFAGQIAYSCFVAWCCNCLFGIIAFILAMVASNEAVSNPREAKRLGIASYAVSTAGIVITVLTVIIVIVVITQSHGGVYATSSSRYYSNPCSYYYKNSRCYRYRTCSYIGTSTCSFSYSGYYSYNCCYYN